MDSEKLRTEMAKLKKKLSEGPNGKNLINDLQAMSDKNDVSGLEFKVKELAKHAQAIQSQKLSDEELQVAGQVKKELEAPYREQVSQVKRESRLIGLILQELNGFQG